MPTIRRADLNDIEDVISLRMAFLRETQPGAIQSEEEVRRLTREYVTCKLPAGEFLVWFAEDEGRIIGTGGLVFFHRPPTLNYKSELHAYILNIYTIPERRGQGTATMLLRHIIEHVKTTPARRISLHASEMGRSIYERCGFTASNGAMTINLQ